MKIYIELFRTFFSMGLFTFGGGYAMLPLLQTEVVENKAWATEEELLDYYAIGQTTPGIIAVNTAVFIGQKQAGALGAVIAVLGLVSPSVVIISLLAGTLEEFHTHPKVASALAGIRVAVSALILTTVIKMGKSAIRDRGGLIIFGIVLFLILGIKTPIIVTVLLGAALGLVFTRRQDGNA
ncbi:MAG TPA: chromate transporter [Clostridia bacterium]|nr:chromate transporter [Clostridia bacterium]